MGRTKDRFDDLYISYAAYHMPLLASLQGLYDIDRIKFRHTQKKIESSCMAKDRILSNKGSYFGERSYDLLPPNQILNFVLSFGIV